VSDCYKNQQNNQLTLTGESTLRLNTFKTRQILKDVKKQFKKSEFCVSFSGGHDSTVLLSEAVKMFGNDINVLFNDTKLEAKETYNYIEEIISYFDLQNFITTKPKVNFWKFFKQNKSNLHYVAKFRFCCDRLKKAPLFLKAEELGLKANLVGIRAEESKRRSKYTVFSEMTKKFSKKRSYTLIQIKPILHFTRANIFQYIEKHKLPKNPLYDLGYVSVGCMICPCPNKSYDYYSLLKKHHKRWYKLIKKRKKDVGDKLYYHTWRCSV